MSDAQPGCKVIRREPTEKERSLYPQATAVWGCEHRTFIGQSEKKALHWLDRACPKIGHQVVLVTSESQVKRLTASELDKQLDMERIERLQAQVDRFRGAIEEHERAKKAGDAGPLWVADEVLYAHLKEDCSE